MNDYFTDIDECKTKTANCDENSVCTNTPGGFKCISTSQQKMKLSIKKTASKNNINAEKK